VKHKPAINIISAPIIYVVLENMAIASFRFLFMADCLFIRL